ncbi:Rha family transcriptional regulator [Advenella mimigardefordensis]|uniref:Putative Rha-like protein n=1 Tax=Advenella mimigardefordensis (strain DSM 17166 / LMG 22922 / DPN7) TaxID=1247726 RepID=W0P8X0_ADVMD|nr:Rha family transcriptional regulator [Advenella mimigardefordensis]AHG63166.1 putative Rha-like protein [Advenella mimigardefordensis DPN7]
MNHELVNKNESGELVTTSMAIALGTSNDHASVIKLVREYKLDLEEFGLLDFKSESSGGRPTEYAVLNEQQATLLITYMRNSEIVRTFKKRLVKAFYELRSSKTELSRIELLTMALAAEQEKIQLAYERDEAVATKAEIGSRREATAMNTASQAAKKAKALETQLDRSKQYATVKRMEMLYHGQKFNWRHLKSTGTEMGIPAIDIFDANYGTVKAYHADVWMEAYALSIEAEAA